MSKKAPGMSLDWKEKIAYGLGGTASHFTFSMVTLYLMYFYTDVAGIGTAAVSVILLVMRIWDGVNDPLMGIIIDKTKTKWGKCRPYFLWMAIPYGLVAVLLFSSPGFSATGKIIWAFVTYFLYDIIYTAINLPLAAVLPMMTENSHERTVLNAVRMFLCMVGTIIVTLFTLKLVNFFGKGDASKGFLFTMILFGALSVVMWLFTFSSVKERVTVAIEKKKKEKVRLRESIKAITKNPPWWILLGINVLTWVGMTMQQATAIYFFKYNLQLPALAPVFMTVSALSTLLGIVIVPSITKKLGKRKTFIIGNILNIFGLLVIAVGGRYSVPLMFVGALIAYCGSGAGTPLIYSLLADTVEYGEWKSGVRAEGLIFSASSFGVKFGMGVGSAITALMLTYGNYIANAVQTESSLTAIRASYLYIPIACTLCVTLLLLFYKLNEKQFEAIKEELIQRRGVVEASTPMMD